MAEMAGLGREVAWPNADPIGTIVSLKALRYLRSGC